jgi:hypothetical protein
MMNDMFGISYIALSGLNGSAIESPCVYRFSPFRAIGNLE